jgi:spore germination cell wall hydrolase CwlJ-like protein
MNNIKTLSMSIIFGFLSTVSTIATPRESLTPFEYVKDSREIKCLAEAIYYESSSEPYEGKLAVAQVVLNRVKHPSYPKNICSVVYQKTINNQKLTVCQFSWTCYKRPVKDWQKWEECLEIARKSLTQDVLHVKLADKKALYFHANYINPGWNKNRIVARIGNHIFYA